MRCDSPTLRISFLSRLAIVTIVTLSALSLEAKPPAAEQKIRDFRGSAADLLSQNRGKVLVLFFVRTDCPISNRYAPRYAPLIQQMSRKYGQEASFRLVFPDRNEAPENIRQFLRDFGYQLPAIRDINHALVRTTSAKVTPDAAVFDAEGTLVYHGRIDNLYEHIGQARRAATTHELADAIGAAIKGVKIQTPEVAGVGCFISDLE